MNPKVDWYFHKAEQWKKELEQLRMLVVGCGLTEELKWGVPCYTYQSRNIVLIHTFKKYCALLFHKGALLQDTESLLIQQTPNVQAARQIRFTNLQEIAGKETVLKTYIYEAIEVEKAGLSVPLKKPSELTLPETFEKKLQESIELKTAFQNLSPGRQKGYILYFSQAKQAKTQLLRIEKWTPHILAGKGLKD